MAIELFYKAYPNPSSSSSLIILHGLFGMLDNWHNMANSLSEFVNVISVDQRNHGQSPHTDEMSFELMADDLAHLMDKLNISKAIVLGHSMGGKTAMVFADRHPDRIEKLIVVDIAPKAYKAGHTLYFKAFNSIDFSKFTRRKEADEALAEIEENSAVRQFLLKNLEREGEGYRLKFNLRAIENFYPKMIDKLEFEWLISIPTLFISGSSSSYILEEDKQDIIETFPNADFQSITDAGHWVHAEQAGLFFEAVKAFIV